MMNERIAFYKKQIAQKEWLFDYPLMDYLNAKILEAEEGYLKMEFKVEQYMLNPIGILHGGIAATMLDELMGAAGFTLGRPVGYATINMNIDFLSSGKAGDIIIGEGRIFRAGKTVLHSEAKLYTLDGKILSKATSNLIATSIPIKL